MLRLLHTSDSPFARKVRMAALERTVNLKLELVPLDPMAVDPSIVRYNPLAGTPVLVTADGALFDSRVICRFLDRKGSGPSLYVSETADIWDILIIEALADGIMDAAVSIWHELTLRPAELGWEPWVSAQHRRIDAALDHLEGRVAQLAEPHIGSIGTGVALDYLDFRHPDRPWRETRPTLAAWLSTFAATEVMRETAFQSPPNSASLSANSHSRTS